MVCYYFLALSCLSLVVSDDSAYPCLTPNEEVGVCISLFSCPVLQRSLGTSTPSAIKFVKESICNEWGLKDLKVCCGKTGNFAESANVTEGSNQPTSVTDKKTHRDHVIEKLLPTKTYCGLQHTDDRFYNDSETALDEFPWLVHVLFIDEEVDDENPLEFYNRCSGVLVNRRYVLTTGYCARTAVKVRLGQYDTNKTVSCIENPNFPECTEPTIDVPIEEYVEQPTSNFEHNFALFRLAKNVSYSDFIRPICLPLHDSRKPMTHEQLVFSGWGAADQKGVVKKRLTYNATNVEECYKLDQDLEEDSKNASPICLAPQQGITHQACPGDQGGPLMYTYNFQWFVDAIMTHVIIDSEDHCSNTNLIHGIRITPEAVEWILENIRP